MNALCRNHIVSTPWRKALGRNHFVSIPIRKKALGRNHFVSMPTRKKALGRNHIVSVDHTVFVSVHWRLRSQDSASDACAICKGDTLGCYS